MLTKSAIDTILKAMWEENGIPENMEEKIEKIREAVEERDTILRNYGEAWDDAEENFDFKPLPSNNDWETKYNDLHSRYIARFFTGGEGDNGKSDTAGETTLDKVKVAQDKDIMEDSDEKTIDELFKEE